MYFSFLVLREKSTVFLELDVFGVSSFKNMWLSLKLRFFLMIVNIGTQKEVSQILHYIVPPTAGIEFASKFS
jgi:hypothetical protein